MKSNKRITETRHGPKKSNEKNNQLDKQKQNT